MQMRPSWQAHRGSGDPARNTPGRAPRPAWCRVDSTAYENPLVMSRAVTSTPIGVDIRIRS